MKIRTDFVTNSSSSCFVTVVVETTDGRKYIGGLSEGDAGHCGGCIINSTPGMLKNVINAATGKDVLETINAAYRYVADCIHSDEGFIACLEEEDSTVSRKELETLPAEMIKEVYIFEKADGDDLEAEGELILNMAEKTEQIEYDENFGGLIHSYKAVKDLKSGEITVIRDEERDEDDEEGF